MGADEKRVQALARELEPRVRLDARDVKTHERAVLQHELHPVALHESSGTIGVAERSLQHALPWRSMITGGSEDDITLFGPNHEDREGEVRRPHCEDHSREQVLDQEIIFA